MQGLAWQKLLEFREAQVRASARTKGVDIGVPAKREAEVRLQFPSVPSRFRVTCYCAEGAASREGTVSA
jgi:hypothetical protein